MTGDEKQTVLYAGMHTDLLPQKLLRKPGDESLLLQMVKKAHPDILIDKVYVDTTETTLDNRAFDQLVIDCANGKIKRIIVPSLFSLSTDAVTIAHCLRKIEKADPDVIVYFALERFSTKDDDYMMRITMHFLIETEYKEMQKRRKEFKAI